MGGTGSGRQDGRPLVDGHRRLDVNRLHRDGCLRPDWAGTLQWSQDDEVVASIGVRAADGQLTLTYRYRWNGGEWQDVEEPIPIVWTPCHFGGKRPWFVCPGVVDGVPCRRRVAKLYGPGRYFLCRHCYGLAYQSQRVQPYERALSRANAIRMRLGGEPGVLSPFPEKPKGMHWQTYDRLQQRVQDAETVAEANMWVKLDRLRTRLDKRSMAELRGLAPRRAAQHGRKEFWS